MVIGGTNLRPKPEDEKTGLTYRQAIVQNSVEVFDIENGWTWSQGMLRNFLVYPRDPNKHTGHNRCTGWKLCQKQPMYGS